jgi:FAD/FMN-containing dehydrogenase
MLQTSLDMLDRAEELARDLKPKMQGRVVTRSDERYEHDRKIWNGVVDRYPAAIAFCETMPDVQAAVRAARDHGTPISVRSCGYDTNGRSVRSDALVIDLSALNEVKIDGDIATIAGGASASKVIAAASEHDRMAVTGWNGRPGMTGLATGGGYGPLIARHGLALDQLIGAELVGADGERLVADLLDNPDLLWALKGGGGNFGVVTSLTVRLHKARPVLGGMILFPWTDAGTTLSRYAEVVHSASKNLSVVVGMISMPDGSPSLFLAPVWAGDEAEGEAVIERLKRCGNPIHAHAMSMGYRDLVQSFDDRIATGLNYALETRWIPSLNAETIPALIEAAESRSSPMSTIILQHFRGTATQIPLDDSAFGLRREHVLVEFIASWRPSDGDDGSSHRDWAENASKALAPMSLPGGYPNILGAHAQDQIAHAYGANLPRLQAIKRRVDPDGVFSATPLPL